MIELKEKGLDFAFREIHPQARLTISFQRTLRVPDDGNEHFLPPGLGRFPLRHVDDHADRLPESWVRHGGVLMPMFQAEALWFCFDAAYESSRRASYPFAIKIATGKLNAVSGEPWSNDLSRDPQNYVVAPEQPWLDGYNAGKGVVRQFVAMPTGRGYTAEEQITGSADVGGIQVQVFPMKREAFERRFPEEPEEDREIVLCEANLGFAEMGVAPGGQISQEIYDDPFDPEDWDTERSNRCFVHLLNSEQWQAVTGKRPPASPISARTYTEWDLPWFDFYREDAKPVEPSKVLENLKGIAEISKEQGEDTLFDNSVVRPGNVVRIATEGRARSVREGLFD